MARQGNTGTSVRLPRGATPSPGIPENATPSRGIPENATPSAGIPANARPSPGIPANATPSIGMRAIGVPIGSGSLHGGKDRVSPKSKKGEALLGRNDNLKSKAKFKSGAQDARDTDGLVTVTQPKGTMRSPAAQAMSKRAAVKRPG
jgi:hypothetical protein